MRVRCLSHLTLPGKKTTTEVFQLFHNFKEQVRPFTYTRAFPLISSSLPLQVRACGSVTKANAAKDGKQAAQAAPAAAGTGKKIAGHSGGDGDPMVFFLHDYTSFCILAAHSSSGQAHRRHQSRKDGCCQVILIHAFVLVCIHAACIRVS